MPDMQDDQRLRDELVRLLKGLPYGGMSEMARAVGVKPASVRLWREGQNVPRPGRWKAIERHLDLEDGHLASFVDDYRTGPAISPPDDVDQRVTELELALKQAQDAIVALRKDVAELRGERRAPRAARR